MNAPTRLGRANRRRPIAEINVVPYIDVCLVLLVIFMVTAPLLQTGVEVDLPQAESKSIDQDTTPPVVVTIKSTGEVFVDLGNHQDVPVDAKLLPASVLAAVKDKPARPVLIRGDKSVPYGEVIAIMASLKRIGVGRVGLMTQPEKYGIEP